MVRPGLLCGVNAAVTGALSGRGGLGTKVALEPWGILCLVLPFINTVTFADGACEARSRSKEEAMQGHRLVVTPRPGLRPAPTNVTIFMKGST